MPGSKQYDEGTPPKKARYQNLEMGVISVKGGGIRVVLSFNDSSCLNSVVKTILICKNVQSGFCRRFKGYMHADNIVINGKQWGKFSYRWFGADERAGATPDDLVQLFPRTDQFKKDPAKPYSGDNKRVTVELLNDGSEVPMNEFFSEEDIVKLCTSDEERYKLWRVHVQPFQQSEAFFWTDPLDHETLKEVMARLASGLQTAPVVGNLTF